MMMIATIAKLINVMPSVEPISDRSSSGWGVAVVWKNMDALLFPANVADWAVIDRLNAILNNTRNRLMTRRVKGRENLFIQLSKYNMRVGHYVLDCSFAV